MTSTTFLETPRFPDDLSIWALGGVAFSTTIVGSTSGREKRNGLWQYGRGAWDLQNTFRKNGSSVDPYTVQWLRDFFRYMKGQLYGFRFRDWTDYMDEGAGVLGSLLNSYTQAPVVTGNFDGSNAMQMFKEYAATPLVDYRIVTKPQGGCSVYRTGVLMPTGTGAGEVEIDTTTGIAQFTADSQATIEAWGTGGSTTLQVNAVPAGWAAGQTLYVSGASGDTGGNVNGVPCVVQSISGNDVVLSAASTGSPSGGVVGKYPQPTETATWTGTFDTPVRFATDQFAPQLDVGSGALYGFTTLQIIEIRPELPTS